MGAKKKQFLTLREKVKIIEAVTAKTATYSTLSEWYNIDISTISRIVKNRTKIIEGFNQNKSRKTMKESKNPQVEEALFNWICQQQAKNCILTSEIIKTKAELIHKSMKKSDNILQKFRANSSWLQRFTKRFDIKSHSISGETTVAYFKNINNFKVSTTYLRHEL